MEIQHLGGQGFIPGVLTAKPVRDILALNPMNVFTWPEHAAHCLPALCARRRHVMLPATDICRIITQAPKVTNYLSYYHISLHFSASVSLHLRNQMKRSNFRDLNCKLAVEKFEMNNS